MINPLATIGRFKSEYGQNPERYSLSAITADNQRIRLRPLQGMAEEISMSDVDLLTEWRNRFPDAFLSEFTATPERTMRWLAEVCGPDRTRILFMVEDAAGTAFGHVGLCNVDSAHSSGEVDNIVRGRDIVPGGMAAALRALLAWARGELGLRHLAVRVMADNPAVRFYERLGFQPVKDVPLVRRQIGPAEFRWTEHSQGQGPAIRSLRYLELAA